MLLSSPQDFFSIFIMVQPEGIINNHVIIRRLGASQVWDRNMGLLVVVTPRSCKRLTLAHMIISLKHIFLIPKHVSLHAPQLETRLHEPWSKLLISSRDSFQKGFQQPTVEHRQRSFNQALHGPCLSMGPNWALGSLCEALGSLSAAKGLGHSILGCC